MAKKKNKYTPHGDELDEIFSSETEAGKEIKDAYKQSLAASLFDWVEVLALSATFVLFIFTFVMRLAVVDGPSMENTLIDGEMLVISDINYEPEKDDIVVFFAPHYKSKDPIVKRVIATEGQTVRIDFDNWGVYVDNVQLDEKDHIKRVAEAMRSYSDSGMDEKLKAGVVVPEGHVFVMGDNRNNSVDSRYPQIGFVDTRCILGSVKLRLFPISRFGTVD